MFKRDFSHLSDWARRMKFCLLGAGALAGNSLPLDRKYLAEEFN
jgi:argininosuccinate lyase